jgi:hypothetical protein
MEPRLVSILVLRMVVCLYSVQDFNLPSITVKRLRYRKHHMASSLEMISGKQRPGPPPAPQ